MGHRQQEKRVADGSVTSLDDVSRPCPCGRDLALEMCCLPLIDRVRTARTAEDLMRSRYTAHVLMRSSYLLDTWHTSCRPEQLSLHHASELEWVRLEVHSAQAGQADDREGVVDYTALGRSAGGLEWLRETATFTRESGEWCYVDGVYHAPPKVRRNDPCPCLSGAKYKRCCGR